MIPVVRAVLKALRASACVLYDHIELLDTPTTVERAREWFCVTPTNLPLRMPYQSSSLSSAMAERARGGTML
jgi:hypothetical protein